MNKRYIVGVAIIVLCGVVGFTAFQGSLSTYVNFAQARELDRTCQVIGEVDKENVKYDLEGGILHFTIIDEEGSTMPVEFSGVKPGNFDQAVSVVCIGQYDDGTFEAERLLVKCPSKYQGLEEAGEEIPHEAETASDGV